MSYKIISRYQIKLQDVPNVVHPSLINTYLRKYSIRRMLEMDEVLVIDHLPKSDGVLDHLGDVKRDIPFTLSGYLKNIVDETECGVARAGSLGGYRNRPVEQAVSVFASLPPLSASVVEYEKTHSELAKHATEGLKAIVEYEQTLKEISDKFVTQSHMRAIKECADTFNMVVTFRESGEFTIDALNRGASAKGHDILEKTLKPKTIQGVYNLTYEHQKVLEAEGLMGTVGHVVNRAGVTTLGGIYSTIYEADSSGFLKAKIFQLDTSSIEMLYSSIAVMKSELGNNWITKLFTGDYDTHDILVGDINGKYHIVEPESKNEHEVIENINIFVSAVDKSREYTPYTPHGDYEKQARHVVRHGAQVNYGWHQMIAEPNEKVIKSVAGAGEFPLAYYSAKVRRWGMVKNFRELKDLYVEHDATMPFYWTNSELNLDTNEIKWQSFNQDKNSQSSNHITINKEHFKR